MVKGRKLFHFNERMDFFSKSEVMAVYCRVLTFHEKFTQLCIKMSKMQEFRLPSAVKYLDQQNEGRFIFSVTNFLKENFEKYCKSTKKLITFSKMDDFQISRCSIEQFLIGKNFVKVGNTVNFC